MGEGDSRIRMRLPCDPKESLLGPVQWLMILMHGAALTGGTFAALVATRWLDLDAR